MAKLPKKIRHSARFLAFETIERVENGNAYSNLLLNEMIQSKDLSDKDRRLYTELVYGTISRKLTLEYFLQPFIKKAKKMDGWVKTLLLLSLYQFEYLDKIPDHAIINEAVEIAKGRGNVGIGKFVNGVLRTIQREGVPSIEQIKEPMERLAIEISMPAWLTEKLVAQIGFEATRELGLSLFEPSHVSARVDLRKMTREDCIAGLSEDGIEARESLVSPFGIIAAKGHLAGSRLFTYGLLTVQDESSMLVAPSMQIASDHVVLDACAAPGGKTTHIATYLDAEQGGKVLALDIHQHKIKLIKENAERLHVTDVVKTEQMDARLVGTEFPPDTFDRILVDAPCSGLGLMRRKPDIKYHKRPADFTQLPKIQLEILESVSQTIKQWGIITYSTCTIVREENEAVVAAFLAKHPNFERVEVAVDDYVKLAIHDEMLTIYPQMFQTDGFFICCLQRKV